jgi:hypothetical protein
MKTRKNCLGTVSFVATLAGMRKAQDFTVYPVQGGPLWPVKAQSDNRWCVISEDGSYELSKESGSATGWSHTLAKHRGRLVTGKLSDDELCTLADAVRESVTGGMVCNNRGAVFVHN